MKKICNMILAVLFLSGCATILSKSEWPVRIESTPEQADVTIIDISNGKKVFTGKTPTIVILSSKGGYFKGKTYRVEVSKEGYATQSIEIRSTINGWYIGNLLFGGLIGLLIVDPLTGAMWTLDPKDINLILEKKTSELPSDQRTLSVISLEDVPVHLRGKLIRVK